LAGLDYEIDQARKTLADLKSESEEVSKGIIGDNRNAPTGPTGAIPSSSQVTGGGGSLSSPTPGWSEPRPLTNPPGTNWVDAIAIADDVRQRKEPKP
jgi:hypothetical protein